MNSSFGVLCRYEYCDHCGATATGSALIEGAIIVPVLLILVLGVFEFSWLIYQQHLISTGIHDARALSCAIREPPRSNDPKATRRI